MATDHRIPTSALIEALCQQPQGADLFQAISLLERHDTSAEPLGHGNGRGETVRLTGHVTLAFTPSDVASVRPLNDNGRHWQLDTPIMSLAGGTGPLPLAFTDMLLQRRAAHDRAPLDFLDIFNHRWLSFLYRSRKLHRPSLQWGPLAQRPLARTLDAISGLGLSGGHPGPQGESIWLRHAGLLGPAPRSMAQLETLLSDRLNLPVRGQQFVGGWLTLPAADTLRLGGSAALGQHAVLGQRAWDAGAGVRLHVGPIPAAHWADYLPGGASLARMAWLVGQYAQQDLQWEVVLLPDTSSGPTAPTTRLGQAKLGWSSWLGGSSHTSKTSTPVHLRLQPFIS
jgi:type VI secretion system protein ImpH